jgi:anaerobic selenocysteine-containing dehydrogenase
VTGNLDIPGGSLFPPRLPTANIKLQEKLPKEKAQKRLNGHELFFSFFNMLSMPSVIDAMFTEDPYPIKAAMVMGGNPLVSLANTTRVREAFKKLDFLVVVDLFMTRTAELADLVLPAATYFEKTGLTSRNLSGGYLLLQQKAVEIDDCWPDWKIIFELAKKLGYEREFPWKDVEEAIEEQLKPAGITIKKLRENPEGLYYQEMTFKKYETKGFMTPSGKVEIYSKTLEEKGYDPLPYYKEPLESPYSQPELSKKYPLIGSSAGKPFYFVQTQLRNIPRLRRQDPEPFVKINPEDAEVRGIKDGNLVRISSERGSIQMKAMVEEIGLPRVVIIPWGWGQSLPEANVHNLTDDMMRCPISGATSSRAFLCEVEKI